MVVDEAATTQDQAGAAAKQMKDEFVRGVSEHRAKIGEDPRFPVETGRYHLYVANNCPWCHRVSLARAVCGLQQVVSMDVMFYRRHPENGWQFLPEQADLKQIERDNLELLAGIATRDSVRDKKYAKDIYFPIKQTSLPILFDKKTNTVVSNESADSTLLLGSFDGVLGLI